MRLDKKRSRTRRSSTSADPKDGTIVAEGRNDAGVDPIWHGEMAAIKNLSDIVNATGKTVYAVAPTLALYTTAEPCPMCMSAITWSGFGRVVYGTSIPYISSLGQPQIQVS